MKSILILTYRMAKGYGVDVVIYYLAEALRKKGLHTHVACIDKDSHYQGLAITATAGDERSVRRLAETLKPDLIVAHTSPFFEMLPSLAKDYRVWAWEHGDPTPSLFGAEASARQLIKDHKRDVVYPAVERVIAISDFIRYDIEWPKAEVLHNSVNYIPDLGPKTVAPRRAKKLRVGTLMRLGRGEAFYKGREIFLELCKNLQTRGADIQASFMGRGEESDAEPFRRAGFEVHLNSSDEEKWAYLRSLDVFVSCSLWEGFNLPLLEAQGLGTVAIALDTGAHPEVCPLVFSNVAEMTEFVLTLTQRPDAEEAFARAAYDYVRENFEVSLIADRFARLFGTNGEELAPTAPQTLPLRLRLELFGARVRALLRTYGFWLLVYKAGRRIWRRFGGA